MSLEYTCTELIGFNPNLRSVRETVDWICPLQVDLVWLDCPPMAPEWLEAVVAVSSGDLRSLRYSRIVNDASITVEEAVVAASAVGTGKATGAGMGAGALGTFVGIGALLRLLADPAALAGVATVGVGAAIPGGAAAESRVKDASSVVDNLGEGYPQEQGFRVHQSGGNYNIFYSDPAPCFLHDDSWLSVPPEYFDIE